MELWVWACEVVNKNNVQYYGTEICTADKDGGIFLVTMLVSVFYIDNVLCVRYTGGVVD